MIKEGLGLQFWPLTKLTTEQTVTLIKTHLPQWCGIFRLLQGEGSDDYDFYKDPETLLKGIEVAKAFDAPVIVPLNGYFELMYQKYGATYKDKAEIARKSNEAIVNEVYKSGVNVFAFAINNELYAKREITSWSGAWTYQTKANIDNTNRALDLYFDQIESYGEFIHSAYKIALPMATDLNKARICWDTGLYERMESNHILDAHLYIGQTVTGLAVNNLIHKRIGRGAGLGKEIIIGELATNFGMYGTEKVNTWARTPQHFARQQEYFDILSKYPTVTAGCLHMAGGYKANNNNYHLIQI